MNNNAAKIDQQPNASKALIMQKSLERVVEMFAPEQVKFIKLKGFTKANHKTAIKERYQEAKKPIDKDWNGTSFPGHSIAECCEWTEADGWIGMVIPSGYILVDEDDAREGEYAKGVLVKTGVKHHAIRTPNGFQMFLKDTGMVSKQNTKMFTLGGFIVDYRLQGKGYTVLPSPNTEGRKWITVEPNELSDMPFWFEPLKSIQTKEVRPFTVPIGEGSRNDTLFKHACALQAVGKSESAIEKTIHFINDVICTPSMDQREVDVIIRSALKYPSGNAGSSALHNLPTRLPASGISLVPNGYDQWKEALEATNRYEVNEYGYLCHKRFNKEGEIELLPLCNFLARPTREIIEDDGLEARLTFEIEGVLAGGRHLPTVMVQAEKFHSMSWVPAAWGMQANVEPGTSTKDKVRHAIQMLSQDIKREHIFTYLGWRKINGSWVYLHSKGAVGAEGIKVNVERESLQRYELPEQTENLNESIRASLQALNVADKNLTYSLLAMVGLAPLCEPLRMAGQEPSFILWVLGESGARKSSVVALFLNHFGDFPNGKTLPAGFKDSANALEKKAFSSKDSLLVVDDYHPKATIQEARQIEQLAQQLLRGYGDHQARSRMKPDGSLRPAYIPRGACIVTGEDVPKAGTSTTARYMAVEVEKGSVDLDKLSAMQDQARMLPHTMRGYLEWLAPQLDELGVTLRDDFKQTRDYAMRSDQHGRLPESVAWMYIGLMVFTDFALEKGVLTEQKRSEMLQEGFDIFLKLASRQASNMVDDKPVNLFLNALQEMIVTDKVSLASTDRPKEKEGYGDLVGYYDDQYYYLIPDSTINAVTQFYQKQNKNFPLTKDMLLKHLETEGLIFTKTVKDKKSGSEKTERSHNKRIGGSQQRVVWLHKTALIIENADEDSPDL